MNKNTDIETDLAVKSYICCCLSPFSKDICVCFSFFFKDEQLNETFNVLRFTIVSRNRKVEIL